MGREQTYRMAVDQWQLRGEKIKVGQCLCESLDIWRDQNREGGPRLVPWQPCSGCGHEIQLHNEYGECQHVDTSMRASETGLPEILR